MNCLVCLKPLRPGAPGEHHARCLRRVLGARVSDPVLGFARADMTGELLARTTRRMSISGVQPKLSMKLVAGKLEPTDTGGEFILKPSPQEYPHAAENEHVTMLIGEAMGVPTAACMLVRFSNGELAYLTRRYDRLPGGGRIHQEDMAQLLGRQRDRDGEYKYSGSYEQAAKAAREAAGRRLSVVYDLFRRLLAHFLVNDGDYHLKNISVWRPGPDGRYQGLAPNYDMLNTRLYFRSEAVLALDLFEDGTFTPSYGACGYYAWADFLELARRVSLTERAAERARREILGQIPRARELIHSGMLPADLRERYERQLLERAGNLHSLG